MPITWNITLSILLFIHILLLPTIGLFWGGRRLSRTISELLYRAWAVVRGVRLVIVKDAALASAILRRFDAKGEGIETELGVVPLWREGMNAFAPLIPVDAADGKRHARQIHVFHKVARLTASYQEMHEIATKLSRQLKEKREEREEIIDSVDIVRLTIAIFIKAVFNKDWSTDMELLVEATLEWRSSVFGKSQSNQVLLHRAVNYFVNNLLQQHEQLWRLYEDEWRKAENYSVLMFTYIVSPAINNVELLVGIQKDHKRGRRVTSNAVDAALRKGHIMQTLERFVDKDIYLEGNLVVTAGTQVIMFTNDFADSETWPVWGSGKRSCPGQLHATKVLIGIANELKDSDLFHPLVGNRYSGRDNDFTWTISEAASRLIRILEHFAGKEPAWKRAQREGFVHNSNH